MKKSKYPANYSFMKEFELTEKANFEVSCIKRKTKRHLVRQMNVKSTYIHEKI